MESNPRENVTDKAINLPDLTQLISVHLVSKSVMWVNSMDHM